VGSETFEAIKRFASGRLSSIFRSPTIAAKVCRSSSELSGSAIRARLKNTAAALESYTFRACLPARYPPNGVCGSADGSGTDTSVISFLFFCSDLAVLSPVSGVVHALANKGSSANTRSCRQAVFWAEEIVRSAFVNRFTTLGLYEVDEWSRLEQNACIQNR